MRYLIGLPFAMMHIEQTVSIGFWMWASKCSPTRYWSRVPLADVGVPDVILAEGATRVGSVGACTDLGVP